MSNYGLQIVNANGSIVIDSNYRNLSIVQTGSVTMPQNLATTVSIARPTANVPIFLVSNLSCGVCFDELQTDANGNFTGGAFHATVNNGTFNYAIASADDTLSSDTYGLRVFDANGKPVYDSGKQYLKIMDIVSFPKPSTYNGSVTVSHVPVANPYYAISAINGASQSNTSPSSAVYHLGILSNTTTSATIGFVKLGNVGGSGAGDVICPSPQYLLVCSLN